MVEEKETYSPQEFAEVVRHYENFRSGWVSKDPTKVIDSLKSLTSIPYNLRGALKINLLERKL